jgi:hypothetical protein
MTRAFLDPGLAQGTASSLGAELAAVRAAHDELTLAEPAPTLAPALPELVALARALGFTRVGVRSDAHAFGRCELAARLRAAGLDDVLVPLYGPSAPCHDYHLGRSGAFAATCLGLDAARAAGLTLAATTAITRSNFRALGELAALLARRGFVAWQLTMPSGIAPSDELFARVVPRFALALPYALHAIEQARGLGLRARLRGAPLCRLGPNGAWQLPARTRRFARACQACAARPQCPGVDPGYLEAYGEQELKPSARTAPPPAPLEPAERLLVEHDLGLS